MFLSSVLDLDGCILDTSLWKEPNFSTQCVKFQDSAHSFAINADSVPSSHRMFMRPYLHDFLRLISPYYDIVIWSQTSWRWLEQKLVELDVRPVPLLHLSSQGMGLRRLIHGTGNWSIETR